METDWSTVCPSNHLKSHQSFIASHKWHFGIEKITCILLNNEFYFMIYIVENSPNSSLSRGRKILQNSLDH